MPCAPRDLGPDRVLGGVGIRADRQPPADVGMGQQPVDRLDQRGGLVIRAVQGGRKPGLDVGRHRRRHDGHRPEEDLAGRPVDADLIALLDQHRADPRGRVGESTSSASAPQTQVLPMPRATTAACEVFRRAR